MYRESKAVYSNTRYDDSLDCKQTLFLDISVADLSCDEKIVIPIKDSINISKRREIYLTQFWTDFSGVLSPPAYVITIDEFELGHSNTEAAGKGYVIPQVSRTDRIDRYDNFFLGYVNPTRIIRLTLTVRTIDGTPVTGISRILMGLLLI